MIPCDTLFLRAYHKFQLPSEQKAVMAFFWHQMWSSKVETLRRTGHSQPVHAQGNRETDEPTIWVLPSGLLTKVSIAVVCP